MPLYQIQGPDGRTYEIEGPEGASKEQVVAAVQAKLANGPKPDGGFFPALKAGAADAQQAFANLGAELGLRDKAGAQRDIDALETYKDRTFKPTDKGWGEAPWQKFKETLGGSLPLMAAPIAVGAVTGPVGAGLMSLAQFTGTNLERQRQEGTQLGQGNLGAAATAAIPQAALDVVSFRMIPGVRAIFGKAGIDLTEEGAKKIAQQSFGKTASDYMLQTGKAMGVEGTTEVAQQALERLQAGLSLDDPKARDEYLESFIGGAVLGGAIAPAGRYVERGKAKQAAAQATRAQEARAQEQLLAQQEQERQAQAARLEDPAYLDDLTNRYEQLRQQFTQLDEAAKARPEKNDFFAQQQMAQARKAREEFRNSDEFRSVMEEMQQAAPAMERRRTEQQQAAQAAQFQQEGTQTNGQLPTEQDQLQQFSDSLGPQIAAAQKAGDQQQVALLTQRQQAAQEQLQQMQRDALPSYADWQGATQRLAQMLEQAQTKNKELADAGADAQTRLQAAQQMTALQEAQKKLADIGKQIDKPVDQAAREKYLTKKAQEAADKGENPQRFLTELAQLQQQPSLFDAKLNGSIASDQQLAEQMAQGREEAITRRKRLDAELEALNRIGDKSPTSPEYLQVLDRAMGLSDNFVAPSPPGETLGLAPDKLAIYQKQQARRQLRNMRQKAREERTPLGEWAAARRQQLVDQFRAAQADDAQRVAQQEAQKQTRVLPAKPDAEAPINLSDESDKRISSLIDALLPKAVGVGERIDIPGGPPDMRAQNAIPRPISAAARAFQGPQVVKGNGPEAFPAERVLAQIRDVEERLQELNGQIKRAGSPKDPAKRQAKEELQAEKRQLEEQLRQLKNRHGQMEGFVDATRNPEDVGPPKPSETSLTESEQPGQKNLFPTKPFQPKAPADEELSAARTAYVQAQDRLEKLRKADSQSGTDPKWFREIATQKQMLADAIKKNPARMRERASATEIAELERDARRYLQLERVAAVGGNQYQGRIREAINAAQEDVTKRRQAVDELEARARRAQQQEAANQGRDVGDLEADRINAQDTSGYRNYKGKPLSPAPVSKKSRDLLEQARKEPPKTGPLVAANAALQQAKAKLEAAQARKHEALSADTLKYRAVLERHYDDARREAIARELADLAKDDVTPLARVAEQYETVKNEPAKLRELAQSAVDAENAAKDSLQKAATAADAAYAKSEVNRKKKLNQAALDAVNTAVARAGEVQDDALRSYQRARADRLELERLVGEDIRRVANQLTNKDINAAAQTVAQAEAERNRVADTERNAPRVAEAAQREAKFAQQEAANEQRARIQTGLDLPGTRVRRATELTSPIENALKRQIADVETQLDRAQYGTQAWEELRNRRDSLEQQLQSLYGAAPKVQETVGRQAPRLEGAAPKEGMRLPERRQGPLARNKTGDIKRATQTGTARLTAGGMNPQDANAVALYTLKTKLAAAEGPAKERLQKVWDQMTTGVDKVDALVKEGERLAGLGPTAQVIAARQQLLDAETAAAKAKSEVTSSGVDAEKELARRKLEDAQARHEAAKTAYKTAFDDYQNSQIKQGEQEEADLPDSIWKDVETPKIEKSNPLNPFRILREFKNEEGKPRFRTAGGAQGMATEAVDKTVGSVTAKWKTLPAIKVVKSEAELPFSVGDKSGKVPGAFHEGTVYLVADNLHDPQDVALTLAHEVSGHFGLRSMLGEDYARTMASLYNGNDKVRQAADAKMRDEGLSREIAVEEVLAEMAETNPRDSSLARAFYAVKRALYKLLGLKGVSDGEVSQIVANARRFVEEGGSPTDGGPGGEPVFRSRDSRYDVLIGRPRGAYSEARDVGLSITALKGRVQFVDRLGGFEEAVNRAEKEGKISHADAIKGHYAARFSDNVNQAVGQFVGTGRVFIDKDGSYATRRGTATLKNVFEHGGDGAQALGKPRDEGNDILTVLATGQRAEAIPSGWQRLGGENADKQRALYQQVRAELDANPKAKAAFETALKKYKEYNDGLIDFLAQGGSISPEEARRLQSLPYAPYYRVEGDRVSLMTDKEKPVVIGNIKSQPELKQMLGDDNKVMPLLEAATKNTYLIARMAMRNRQASEMANVLYKIGAATKKGKGAGPAGESVMHFKVRGEDHFAVIDQDVFGVPAELIYKGLEGIKTTLPMAIRMLGKPSHWIRAAVTRMPTYAARQMLRDPINAVFTNGMDMRGVMDAYKNMGRALVGDNKQEHALMDSLVVTSNIYASDAGDMTRFVQQAARGNAGAVRQLMHKLDEIAQSADAATRTALYDDSRAKGMSHMEASLRALESMNFNRRGLSPTMQMLSTMVPFFNAQVQGLDVLWKAAATGKMPFAEQLKIRQKLWARGAMLTAASLAYAATMRDDEDYRKLRPQDRYQNFYFRTPLTKDFVKIPIPYEAGVLFKAIPEAIFDVAESDTKAKHALAGLAYVAHNSMPDPTGVAGVAPLVKAAFNNTGFGPIETNREQQMEAPMRYRDTTSETTKELSSLLHSAGIDVSPLMMEHFIRSYLGGITLGAMRVLMDPVVMGMAGKADVQKPTGGEADTPFVGGLFGRTDARFLIDRAYERMDEINKAKKTFDELVKQGQRAEAIKYAQEKSDELAMADIAGTFRKSVGDLFSQERAVRMRQDMTTEQKDALIEKIKRAQNQQSQAFYEAVEKRKARSSRP